MRSILSRQPLRPFGFHLVSGATIDVLTTGAASVLQNTVMVLQDPTGLDDGSEYDVLSLRNIERIEILRH